MLETHKVLKNIPRGYSKAWSPEASCFILDGEKKFLTSVSRVAASSCNRKDGGRGWQNWVGLRAL